MKKKPESGLGTWARVGLGLLVAIGLLILAKAASAGNVAGASALQKNSTNSGTNGLGIQLVVGTDFNGNSGTGMTVNCTNCGGGGAGTVSVNVQNFPTPTPGIQPVSPTSKLAAAYEVSASHTTHTTTTYNVTATAGADGNYNITWRAVRGGTSIIYAINASATPQATVATLDGREVITGASHKTEGPCYESGTHVHARASGTASVVGTLILERCK